ncbi:MAG: hypothetical protein Q9160_006344 [Pyrenula sp. 1 TL-2023]
MVLGNSLRDGGAKAKLVVLATPENLSNSTIEELKTIYDDIVPISRIINKTPANLYLMERPDLISTFTKIELWKQTQYRQIVYIDADAVVLKAPNELLSLKSNFAAAPDIGWPDCFNSGVMVLRPNMGDYYSLLALAQRGISFDGADQGLLNMHFRDWERLSFTYNCTPSGSYQYVPAYKHFQSSINIVHFIGQDKPWDQGRNTKHTGVYDELLGRWWSVYDKHYRVSVSIDQIFPPDKSSYISGQPSGSAGTVQKYVAGESVPEVYGFSSSEPPTSQPLPASTSARVAGELPQYRTEPAKETPWETSKPVTTVEQKRFSTPQVVWNAAHAPPPLGSKPEASNFPSTRYSMSDDPQLFKPPSSYPEPPKDMWYKVPPKTPALQKPPQIFPWESRAPKPTRVFPDERPPSPSPDPLSQRQPSLSESTNIEESLASSQGSPNTPSRATTSSDPWQSYSRGNAWDNVPEIQRYVQAFAQARKGKVQILHRSTPSGSSEGIMSPPTEDNGRRPSLILTDFPTEIERPSLPVTPAPIRRGTFWGEDKPELGDLPGAEGVPKQTDWVNNHNFSHYCCMAVALSRRTLMSSTQDPLEKLEELQRRQSEALGTGPTEPFTAALPERKMPESQVTPAPAASSSQSLSQSSGPELNEPDFGQEADKQGAKNVEEVAPEIPISA